MSHSYSDQKSINSSSNQSFAEILDARLSRRDLAKSGAALAVLSAFPLGGCATAGRGAGTIAFTGIAASTDDAVRVPPGHGATVLYAWGDPIGHPSGSPAFKPDASNTADEQALQAGMHHDGIHYFPLPYGADSSGHGLLAMNHEYTDDGLLHPGGFASWSADKVPQQPERPWRKRHRGGARWHEFDERFDAGKHPNEPNRFGWIVEFDPYDPGSVPAKRTALGRFSHEGACPAMANDGRVVMYLGDDRAFEYIYKFVSRDRVNPADRAANRDLLDQGTLYVAKFNEDGSGVWVALVHGQGKLNAEGGFADQAEVLIKTRQAADALGATRMDRPEWIAVHPRTKEVYCTLTNNANRGTAQVPGLNAANPRSNNVYGHIIRWREDRNDPASPKFQWDIFVFAGDPQHPEEGKRGNIKGDAFGSPDGLWFDDSGLLWIQTDVSTSTLNKGHYERIGNNQMLLADVRTGEIRRFLTGPRGCEVTGVIMTPDARTMFVNIQHPGESPSERSDPKQPQAVSTWPDGPAGGRPRSATVVIRRNDGGVIGT